jgi:hypothetical protein
LIGPLPASVLPTLASVFVSRSVNELYLPTNLLGLAACGSDFWRSDCALYPAIGS